MDLPQFPLTAEHSAPGNYFALPDSLRPPTSFQWESYLPPEGLAYFAPYPEASAAASAAQQAGWRFALPLALDLRLPEKLRHPD